MSFQHSFQHYKDPVQLYDVVFVITPRLEQARSLVNTTLQSLIDNAKQPQDLLRYREMQRKLMLEIQMIHANLTHLLERYRADVQALLHSQGAKGNREVSLDEMEKDAMARAREIYQKVVEFQTGRRSVPW
ncbi:hypothetical protein OR573_14870 [Halomonas sp. CH40]